MRVFWRGVIVTAILGLCSRVAVAQSAPQTVQYQVNAINVIAFTGSPTLTISVATPGSAPDPVTSSAATWAVTTNQTGAKITAKVNVAMPAGLTLDVTLAPPTGGASTGVKTMTTTAQDMVTGITKLAEGGLAVTYTLTATSAAGVVSGSATITYTITGGV
jgi:hypothetical protein